MSGGHFNYTNDTAKDAIFGWSDSPRNVFEDREISELVWDVFDLIHDFDYYKSGDTCKETYLERKAAFKKKWFGGSRGLRIRRTIDQAIEEARAELYETYGLEETKTHDRT